MALAPVPLPPTHENLQGSPLALAAYARLLALESEHPIEVRVCGWMMIHAPWAAGQAYVATCIGDSANDKDVIAWGSWFLLMFLLVKAMLNKPTPTPSDHPSRPDLDVTRAEILASLNVAPQNHGSARKRALVRDNYRCMLSGAVDSSSFKASTQLQNTPGINVVPTECTHILPQYLGQELGDPFRASTHISCFGDVRAAELNGPEMHNLRNILTLQCDCHASFDSLDIWLEPIDVCHNPPVLPAMMTDTPSHFQGTEHQLALPERRYLALHAAYAKVVNMSGAGEFIDKFLDDAAETKVLSGDGSSGELLALHQIEAEGIIPDYIDGIRIADTKTLGVAQRVSLEGVMNASDGIMWLEYKA
ncbi:hypothetical protein FRC10_011922 [Ceratobasidium sp. 414]|nr:hypothetical protein FRC10_011922 [Ceratobasidium sp. 414]